MTIFFLGILITIVAGLLALAGAAAGVVVCATVITTVLGIATHRFLPWLVLAIGFCALFFVNYAGAHEFRRGSVTRNHEGSTHVSVSDHDPLAELMFGGMQHDRRIRIRRLYIPADTFAADLPGAAQRILPPPRFRTGSAKRHALLTEERKVTQRRRELRNSPSKTHWPLPSSAALSPTIPTWELTKMCIEEVQLFQEWKRKHPQWP
jgi:hypothetical protein